MKVGIQIFWYQIVLCHSYCSSGSRNVWLQGNFAKNARSESLPEYSPKLEIKYLESENKYSVKNLVRFRQRMNLPERTQAIILKNFKFSIKTPKDFTL